jgi:hypothetical protein
MSELAVREPEGLEEMFGLELKIIDVAVGKITTNAAQLLEAAKNKCLEYKDVEKFIGNEDLAKKERAKLNKAAEKANDTAKRIKDMWMAPLDEFDATMKQVKAEFKTASGALDELVKNVENKEKEDKRRLIQEYFNAKNFNLVPLERIFNERWLNKTCKLPDVQKEIDAKIAGIYENIQILERIGDQGLTAKAFYLQTLDITAALKQVDELKANAERLEREQKEREEQKLQKQAEEKVQEELEAIPMETPVASAEPVQPDVPKVFEYVCRFRGTREDLAAMRMWMVDHNIAYEKIEERILQ